MTRAFEEAVGTHGRIEILVNNAGLNGPSPRRGSTRNGQMAYRGLTSELAANRALQNRLLGVATGAEELAQVA